MKHAHTFLMAATAVLGISQAAHAQLGVNLISDGSFQNAITGTSAVIGSWSSIQITGVPQFASSTETITASTQAAITAPGSPFTSAPFSTNTPTYTNDAPATFAVFNNNGGESGQYLAQLFQTQSGTLYQLSFQYFAYGFTATSSVDLEAEVSDPSLNGDPALAYTIDTNATSSTNFSSILQAGIPTYPTETVTFVGNGDVLELDIADISATGSQALPMVTNVQVIDVPEPVSMVLMGAGLAGLGVARRRRRV